MATCAQPVRAMPLSKQHKQASRERILDSATALFRRHGFAGASVKDIMAHAGMTHGGFYAHFPSKSALLAEVAGRPLDYAEQMRQRAPERQAAEAVAYYLAPANRVQIAQSCSLATLLADFARMPDDDKPAFAEQVSKLVAEFEKAIPEESSHRRADALIAVALSVAGVTLGRALGDDALAEELQSVCRKKILSLLAAE